MSPRYLSQKKYKRSRFCHQFPILHHFLEFIPIFLRAKMPKYLSGSEIRSQYGISTSALHRWAKHGRINIVRTPGKKRLYSSTDIQTIFRVDSPKTKICYARVSSDKQQEDLQRQIGTLRQLYPDHELLSDIGSDIDFKRRSFVALLERILRGTVQEVCVLYKDRLCRFGYELVELICRHTGTNLIVVHHNNDRTETEDANELSQDLLSIVTGFVARHHGQHAAGNRRTRFALEDASNSTMSDESTETDSPQLSPYSEADVQIV